MFTGDTKKSTCDEWRSGWHPTRGFRIEGGDGRPSYPRAGGSLIPAGGAVVARRAAMPKVLGSIPAGGGRRPNSTHSSRVYRGSMGPWGLSDGLFIVGSIPWPSLRVRYSSTGERHFAQVFKTKLLLNFLSCRQQDNGAITIMGSGRDV